MDIIKIISEELNIRHEQADAAVRLIDEGNTIPFIARYRKEVTGSLNDEIREQGGSPSIQVLALEVVDMPQKLAALRDEEGQGKKEERN